jgi:hypothetical protein
MTDGEPPSRKTTSRRDAEKMSDLCFCASASLREKMGIPIRSSYSENGHEIEIGED